MKRMILLVTGMLLGGLMVPQNLIAHSYISSDRDLQGGGITENEIKVFPNPSEGRFQLTIDYPGEEKVIAKIFDITGKLVENLSEELVKEDASISAQVQLDHPRSGIYFLRIEIGKKILTKKFIVR